MTSYSLNVTNKPPRNKASSFTFKRLLRAVDMMARDYFAPYIVMDCYGSRHMCWTMAEAQNWLAYSSPLAFIVGSYEYDIIQTRIQ